MSDFGFTYCIVCGRVGAGDGSFIVGPACPVCERVPYVCKNCRKLAQAEHLRKCILDSVEEQKNAVGSNVGKDSGSGVHGGSQ